MRQYVRKHIEFIVLAFALITAMFFQYLRIANLNIAFLFDVSPSLQLVYVITILCIPVIVLFFIFVPLLFIFEITYNFHLPIHFEIKISESIYKDKVTAQRILFFTKSTTVLRC